MSAEKPTKPSVTTSKISGHVYSTDGSGLKSAKVTCNEMETRTLADGFFVFNNLAPGTYEVAASLQSFKTTSKAASIQEGEDVTVDFHLPEAEGTAKICGHVYDAESKKPVAEGGTIILILTIANKYRAIDKNGYYEFENLPAGTYKISTSLPEYADHHVTLTVTEDEIKTHDFFCRAQDIEEPPWG